MEKIKKMFEDSPEVLGLLMFILGGVLTAYITNNFFTIFAPFIIAYVVTIMLRPSIVKLKTKAKMPNAMATTLCLILFVITVCFIVFIFGYYVTDGISYIINALSSNSIVNDIVLFVKDLDTNLEIISEFLHIDIQMENLTSMLTDAAKTALGILSNVSVTAATTIPSFIISFVIGCVAAFYMLYDYDNISRNIKGQMSEKTKQFVSIFNNQVLTSLIKMIFSYAFLSFLCFFVIMIGFWILGIKDAVFLAIIISIFDVLPVVGSGGILAPSGIIYLLLGDPFKGVGMFVLWGVVIVVRQVTEPYVVGSQVGLYPLITVATLYIGLKTMGGLGLIVAPLYVIVCKKLNEEGLIHLYKNKNEHQKRK